MNVPSAFNSQSTRIVLLLGKNHKRLWEITKETLKRIVSAEVFKGTEAKIDGSLARPATERILFYEDKAVVDSCKTPSLLTTTNSRFGHSKHPPCTNWLSGQCWKMPA